MSDCDIVCDLVIDYVVELLGKRYKKSQIKIELADKLNGGKALNIWTFNLLMREAKKKIRSLHGIDPLEYKGQTIEWLESVIRDDRAPLNYKLRAQEQLTDVLGLKSISTDDPLVYATKVAEALRAMDGTVKGTNPNAPIQESIPQSDDFQSEIDTEEVNFEYDKDLKEALKFVELSENGLSLKEQ